MDPNLKSVPGWIIDRPTYSRMATWELKLVREAVTAFNPDLSAEANYEPLRAVVNRYDLHMKAFISIRVCGHVINRPELDTRVITIYKGRRVLLSLYETEQGVRRRLNKSL
ncbi:hypothetical protein [Spirosoma litoris]